jgi:hypothetical protein
MAVAFMQEFAPTDDTSTTNYDAIAAKINASPWPEGNLIHTAGFAPDGTFRIFDVWDTKEHMDAFMNGTLWPLIEEMMGSRADAPAPPVKEETYELHDVAGATA